mmetsp:Transcript_34704/g.81870  ORF Transcript_34704/g.81870 Transcript_34704/m.81870 type:complete len:251 (-) Transcript_34704:14-766(-)
MVLLVGDAQLLEARLVEVELFEGHRLERLAPLDGARLPLARVMRGGRRVRHHHRHRQRERFDGLYELGGRHDIGQRARGGRCRRRRRRLATARRPGDRPDGAAGVGQLRPPALRLLVREPELRRVDGGHRLADELEQLLHGRPLERVARVPRVQGLHLGELGRDLVADAFGPLGHALLGLVEVGVGLEHGVQQRHALLHGRVLLGVCRHQPVAMVLKKHSLLHAHTHSCRTLTPTPVASVQPRSRGNPSP